MYRWWIYQRERFPLAAHAPLIAVFSISVISCSALLRGAHQLPASSTLLAGFVCTLLFFLQLRIADEFKDYEDDLRYRPYRPVPRGLLTLRELGFAGLAAAAIQLGAVLWLAPALLPLLLLTWCYMALMSVEFFAPDRLRAQPVIYLISHMLILPIIAFFLTAWDWSLTNSAPPDGLIWVLLVSFGNGLVFEIGRKVRAPEAEEPGVETYTMLWGRRNAVLVWLVALALTAASALLLAWKLQLTWSLAILPGMLLAALVVACCFLHTPRTGSTRLIEGVSGLWMLLLYSVLGIVPLTMLHVAS